MCKFSVMKYIVRHVSYNKNEQANNAIHKSYNR